MQTRPLGPLSVSTIGLGCNNFGPRLDQSGTNAVVDAALDAGVHFFDTADIYGNGDSERFLGRALQGRRDQAVIATKFGHRSAGPLAGGHPDIVRRAADASLARLGVDHIDLYQLHSPDPSIPIDETLGALGELVAAGKVRTVGCSNFTVDQLRDAERAAASAGTPRMASVQNHYNLLHREPEQGVLAECERAGIAFLPYYPLESGLLSGKYQRGAPPPEGTRLSAGRYAPLFTDENLATVDHLSDFARSHGHDLLSLAVSWLLARSAVASVIAGAMSPEQVRANASAANWPLSASDLGDIDALLTPAS